MFVLSVNKNQLSVQQREPVTSGSANVYQVSFTFSEDWNGLDRTAVFRSGTGSQPRAVRLTEDGQAVIPWEVLKRPNVHLFVGVYGTQGGRKVLPTVWADLGIIQAGVKPGEKAQPPTPDLWEQELAGKGDRLSFTEDQNLGLYSGDRLLSEVPLEAVRGPSGKSAAGVESFNGRQGKVTPQKGDYTADQISFDSATTGLSAENVQAAIEELFTSVSEGKALIASAVTGKGAETADNADFETIAENIKEIPSGGLPEDVFKINLKAEPPEYGTVIGGGFASKGMTITVKGKPEQGYSVHSWKDGGVTVSEDSQYTFVVENDTTLTATFEKAHYFYGYDIVLSNPDPSARVSYPSGVDNFGFTPAKMNFGGQFSYGSWPSAPGEKFMPRPCMLLYSGAVGYYLDPNDYTKKTDGGASDVTNINYGGNAMMEWPKIYTKRWEENGVYHFRCSDSKLDDEYECWCNYDINNNEIPHFYTHIYFGSKDSSGRLRSMSGQDWTSACGMNAQQEIAAAKLNGEKIWFTEVIADHFLLQDLLVMMFKSTNLQSALGTGNCSSNAGINSGTMNRAGLFWGTNNLTSGVKAFGIEHLWSNVWRRIAGWVYVNGTQKVKLTRGIKDGTIAADYDLNGDGYLAISGSKISASGYISGMKTEKFGRLPLTANGSNGTFESDYINVSNTSSMYGIIGGCYVEGLYYGPFCGFLAHPYTRIEPRYIGATISCKPLATGPIQVSAIPRNSSELESFDHSDPMFLGTAGDF